ncbi:MAG: FAD-dependent oxidoreductase [Dehalococcoidia bacterium]
MTLRILLIVMLSLAVMLFFSLGLDQTLSLESAQLHRNALLTWKAENPLIAALIYFSSYIFVTALSLPGAAVMTLAGGALLGLAWGTLLASFASSMGATLAFLAARFVLRDWIAARFGARLQAVNEGMEKDGGVYLFTLRLVPIFPSFVINLAMGLTSISVSKFYWVSQAGKLVGTVTFVNAGTQLARLNEVADILSTPLIASLALIGGIPLLSKRLANMLRTHGAYRGWRKPRRFDRNLIVIGAGSAGLVSSFIAATINARVTLVERDRLEGDCLNTGCVPSKALIRSARMLSHRQRAAEFGLRSSPPDFEFSEVMERVQRVIGKIEPHDSVARYTALGVDVVMGDASIVSPWEVQITRADGTTQRLSTRAIVIATGARPFVPSIPGLEEVGYVTSDTIWALRALPHRLLILGGGPIGCEMAQAFARLGSRVIQVEMAPRILMREDPEVSATSCQRFAEDGIELLLEHQAKRFALENGIRILIAEHKGSEIRVEFDTVLISLGRAANLTGYGLETLGIPTGGTIDVNEYLQTRFPNIYAAGDVAGPYQFTHTAAHQAWYATVNALFSPFRKFRTDYSVIPWATFVEPEVARVGLNELEANARKVPYELTRFGIDDLDRAIADSEAHGFVKILTVPGKDRILGVTIVGEHAGDLIAEYILAMRHGLGLNKILATIHIYPTLAEANKYAAGMWKKTHAPRRILAWLGRFHQWRLG